jgi:hypothetical protein
MNYYDSTEDTKKHIDTVRGFITEIKQNLSGRSSIHDLSKLQEPEKSMYDEFTPKLRDSTYGSDEYKSFLRDMGAALQHHYEVNSHHPEHYPNGINGMSLLDLIEMLADWKAAGMRHANGDIAKSLEINRKRFEMSDQLFEIFKNTVLELGW